jgi:hypothetical protein
LPGRAEFFVVASANSIWPTEFDLNIPRHSAVPAFDGLPALPELQDLADLAE